jgi:hypothetical protein
MKRRALLLTLTLLLSSRAFAGVAYVNTIHVAGSSATSYQLETKIICVGATAAINTESLTTLLFTDTKAQAQTKLANGIIAACAAKGVTVVAADIRD